MRRTLVLLRHGESDWNARGIFTGWVDVGLSAAGHAQARTAGLQMKEAGLLPSRVHTSLLRRAVTTANLALDAADRHWIPVRRSWRLNERHYGALQGRSKSEVLREYGEAQYQLWRRSYDVPPPPLPQEQPADRDTGPVDHELSGTVPRSECLKDVMARLIPYWESTIVPDLEAGHTVLVAAHGTSLRGMVKHLEGISEQAIAQVDIPTGVPLVYELSSSCTPVEPGGRYLGGRR